MKAALPSIGEVLVEPLPAGEFPGGLRADGQREASRFSASWGSTMDLLDREVHALGARQVILRIGLSRTHLRRDGWPRADARPAHPGVVVHATTREGRELRFACDRYAAGSYAGYLQGWQANLRAVALGLEALRAVDRHGITRGAEQYQGFEQLPPGPSDGPPAGGMTLDEAARFLTGAAGFRPDAGDLDQLLRPDDPDEPLGGGTSIVMLFRLAAQRLHPDHGGDREEWERLRHAHDLLLRAAARRPSGEAGPP